MPEPTPDAVPPVGADGNRDLDRYAEGSLEPGLVVAQANLYVSAVESGGEGTRRVGRGLGIGAWLAIGWLAFIVIVAVLAQLGVLPLKDPNRSYVSCARRGPFSTDGTASGFLLGCDSNGRDMIARLAYGSWSSLIVATGAVLFGLVFGGTFGLIAGYFGRRTDAVITSLFNVFLAIPAVVLALALVAFLAGAAASTGRSSVDPKLILILAIGIVSIPLLGRITRASALSWSQREFVLAARAQGAKPVRIMLREVLPNVLPAMFSIALLGIAVAIVAEGTLSILGVGVRPPTPSWGNIIGLDRGRLKESPHIIFLPALMIFFTVLSLNFLGDVVRARLDVRESAV